MLVVAHDAMLYGAQISLLDILGRIDKERYEPHVVIPSAGPFTEALRASGIPLTCGVVQRWIFFPKPMTLRAILRRPWRRLNHPYVLAFLSWLSLPFRVIVLVLLMRKQRVDLVYTNTATVLDGALAARLCSIPHVWHLREGVAGNRDLSSPLPLSWLPGFALSHSATVITNSAGLACRLFGNASPPQVKVVHNGIDSAAYLAEQPEPPLPSLVEGTRLAAVCGALQERKDVLTYIRSAARLRDSHPELHHLLIGQGSGDYLARLQNEIDNRGLTDRVHLLGYRSDMPALLSAIDVLVSTAVDEPFGRTLIEAMAAGKPVVSTRSGGPEEIIIHGECGFLAEVGDDAAVAEHLACLLDDAELYAAMGKAARERVLQYFDLDTSVRKIERIFDEALRTSENAPDLTS
ncbi:glycosyltransferase family 4 protein [Pseudothauera rhizosphaerae]|uniref:glycosyltransferase family 4 protein n=1 Tax=Pseudothauera rhizosphaerae TaxID=2565932 RepID=UPI001454C73B|nr:glycosyltransferase family 4 protein [Pseudothauera rhizosphaerae]